MAALAFRKRVGNRNAASGAGALVAPILAGGRGEPRGPGVRGITQQQIGRLVELAGSLVRVQNAFRADPLVKEREFRRQFGALFPHFGLHGPVNGQDQIRLSRCVGREAARAVRVQQQAVAFGQKAGFGVGGRPVARVQPGRIDGNAGAAFPQRRAQQFRAQGGAANIRGRHDKHRSDHAAPVQQARLS